jgi:hypothetical protein
MSAKTTGLDSDLVEWAKEVDAEHRERYQRPISVEGLRKMLGVGAERSRVLTRMVRAEWRDRTSPAVEAVA